MGVCEPEDAGAGRGEGRAGGGGGSAGGGGCAVLHELIAWHPVGDLDADEQHLLEEHVSGCAACAAELRAATDVRARLLLAGASHPLPETLVAFAEGGAALAPLARGLVRAHVSQCSECAAELTLLAVVERDTAAGPPPQTVAAGGVARTTWIADGVRSKLRRLIEVLVAVWRQPAPAALVAGLVVALIAMQVIQPAGDGPTGPTAVDDAARSPLAGVGLRSVVLLSDETSRLRSGRATAGEEPPAVIAAAAPDVLLLELAELASPPTAAELFTVTVRRAAAAPAPAASAGDPVAWRQTVRGDAFSDSYTLGLVLAAGSLSPGRYEVAVTTEAGEIVFRSRFAVR